jgi:cyclic pyranopterin phosphate synthase
VGAFSGRARATLTARDVNEPTHIAPDGSIAMVDVSGKDVTRRTARAEALVRMSAAAKSALQNATLPKGDAFVTARLAGIMAAKQTPSLIPLAHPIPIGSVDVDVAWVDGENALRIEARATTNATTGIEMEAMVAAAVAALTIYDMAKAIDKSIEVAHVRLLEKTGGKSGSWTRP